MKILVVSSFLPYPLFSGGHVRLYNLIKELSSSHEITLICEKRFKQTEKDIKEVEKICKKVIVVSRKRQWSARNLLKTAISSHSFLVTGHTSVEMKKVIEDELKKIKFDLIHVETYYIMQNLPATSIPIVLAEHNIEYKVYKKYVDQVSIVLKPILSLDIVKIKNEEEKFWKKADKLIAVSMEDSKVMYKAGITASIIANGVNTKKFTFLHKSKSKNQKEKKILFIGDFKWIQNRDTVQYIIEEIWPEIRNKNKEQRTKIVLWIVGREIPQSIKDLSNDSDVIFDESKSALPTEKLFQDADILLAPIRVGGGTSYKILESMSCGTPVVATPLSAESLEAADNLNIMVGSTASELAEKTLELLSDKNLYDKVAKNGRKLIEENYTWKKIAKDLNKVYEEARSNS